MANLLRIFYLNVRLMLSDAARASGITVIIKGVEVDKGFSKLLFQSMDEVQVGPVYLCEPCMMMTAIT